MKYLIVVLLLVSGCSTTKNYNDLNSWSEGKDKSVQLSVKRVKWKSSKADITLNILNGYPHYIVLKESPFQFEVDGQLSGGGVNKRVVMYPGETKTFTLTFELPNKSNSSAKLRLVGMFAGDETVVSGVNSKANSRLAVFGDKNYASGYANTSANAETYLSKSAVEGRMLPPVSVFVER